MSIDQMIGQVVHDTVATALRQFERSDFVYPDLAPMAVQNLKIRLQSSFHVANVVRSGKRPPSKEPVLLHHLDNGPCKITEIEAKKKVENHVRAFQTSSAWEFLQKSDKKKWEPIDTSTCTKPSIEASKRIGFQRAFDLRVYTPYDLALRYSGDFIIVDWKTGKRSSQSLAKARKQTVSYSLWALNHGISLENIRVQPYWLNDKEAWNPQAISRSEVRTVQEEIEAQDAAERALLRITTDANGVKTFHANIDDFQATPGWACKGCKFRSICPDRKEP